MLIFVVINGFTYSRFVSGSLPLLLKDPRSFVVSYFGTELRPYTTGLYHVMYRLFLLLTIRAIIFKEIPFLSCVIINLATSTYFISIQRTFFLRKLFRFPICIILAYIRTKFSFMNDKRFFRTKIFRTIRFLESFSVFFVVIHLFHDKILLSSSLNL